MACSVPGAEGRVGMAALVVDDELDLDGLSRHVVARLAGYARPVFLRIVPETRHDLDLQAAEVRSRARGLRPGARAATLYTSCIRSCSLISASIRSIYGDICEGKVRL